MSDSCHKSVLCFILFAVCLSCTKSKQNPVTTTVSTSDTIVYIAGDNGKSAILWQNGIPDTLSSSPSTANQVILSGKDIYVAGVYQGTTIYNPPGVLSGPETGQYVYWENGIPNNIDSFGNIYHPASISVSGSDVYYSNGQGWKNGTQITFPGIATTPLGSGAGYSPGSVLATFSSGTDVYFAGSDSMDNAVYWKNGNLNLAASYHGRGSTLPLVSCLYVSGSDVYVGGMFDRGVYWLNGAAYFLTPRTVDMSFVGKINSIFVSGNDVYTTGKLIPSGLSPGVYLGAAYWKNGVENDLQTITPPDAFTSYTTTSVFVFGADIYVSGYSSYYPPPYSMVNDSAVYWKNGVEVSLHSPGVANSIYVQQTTGQ